jgi:glutamate-ammonia-ligase adenylyltransferase
VDPRLVEEHFRRLDPRYFERFSEAEIGAHVRELSLITPEHPVRTIFRPVPDAGIECTVLAFDYPSVFSLIAGVLASMGFNTHSGDVFTYAPEGGTSTPLRRLIIDCFTGTLSGYTADADWEKVLSERLERIVLLLEKGGSDSLSRTKKTVNEMAARAISEIGPPHAAVLYPVGIEVDASLPSCTRMRVVSQDTPFFLFTFSTALSLQGVSIEHVRIRTEGDRIEDDFEFVDISGRKIDDQARIDRIKLSVLLTKQFTSSLEGSPDPLAALVRFENLVPDILSLPGQGRWFEMLSNQRILSDLANLLGASTFLWEDFIRLQYETLIPMLRPHVGGKSFCEPVELLPERLEMAVRGAAGLEEFAKALNEFKDREIFLYDLDHILTAGSDFLTLSRRLTALAETVVDASAAFSYGELTRRFGEPRTVAGIPVRYAVMGLGKMGGVALGYASDIELLFVYSDSGTTSGPEVIENGEFFDRLVRETQSMIHAKREGIFHIDLRLRPYGASGPLACGLAGFCTYYAKGGPAHSLERLALVRLRAVAGDRELGARIERLRDDMVYAARSVNLAELREMREKQVREKTRALPSGAGLNAKFSPGALVDLEYAVQILQLTHGAEEVKLRTPRIHEALDALASIGVLAEIEARELVAAYYFFRRLINGLRMLRGSAQDLFLPAVDSDEYMHLARRAGYAPDKDMSPAQKLHVDFETHTAEVRAFVERHFGRNSLPGAPTANAADLILSEAVSPELARSVLAPKGFRDPAKALVNLRNLSGEAERRSLFARLAVLACDILSQKPDPDMALNNWERFLHSLPDAKRHLADILQQPMRLEILLGIFSASQFLADTLIKYPELFEHIGRSEVLRARGNREIMDAELRALSQTAKDRTDWQDALRRFRRSEMLRIGARDVCLGVPTRTIMEELSDLADALIGAALRRALGESEERSALRGGSDGRFRFCVVAFGKLGGRELNYSSDIDLLGVCGSDGKVDEIEEATAVMETLRGDLSAHTSEGYVYRVDLRLRPYGSSGQLVFGIGPLFDYYSRSASLWELQALLKARPVAGDLELGSAFSVQARELLLAPHERSAVVSSIDTLRKDAVRNLKRSFLLTTDVKVGLGGLRDIEFLVQGLQLVNARSRPELLGGNTLSALEAMGKAGILAGDVVERLSGDYLFLRRVEHFLQIYEDRQTHSLPRDPEEMRALARRMLGSGATADQLTSKLSKRFERVREEYLKFSEGG